MFSIQELLQCVWCIFNTKHLVGLQCGSKVETCEGAKKLSEAKNGRGSFVLPLLLLGYCVIWCIFNARCFTTFLSVFL